MRGIKSRNKYIVVELITFRGLRYFLTVSLLNLLIQHALNFDNELNGYLIWPDYPTRFIRDYRLSFLYS